MTTNATTPSENEAPSLSKNWSWLDEHSKQLASHGERIAVLEVGQNALTATLNRIEAEVAKLGEKIDKVNAWLLGSLFAVCLALLGLVVNLLRK
jgi:hypothetical protein